MAWIRLDDQIAHHPKFLNVSVGACWLYITGLGYCQKFLTDGFIPDAALKTISHVDNPIECAAELVNITLWDRGIKGHNVHDYLDFNEHSSVVKERRRVDRQRKQSRRNPEGFQTESCRIPDDALARAPASHPIPSLEDKNKLISKADGSVAGNNGNQSEASHTHPQSTSAVDRVLAKMKNTDGRIRSHHGRLR